MSPTWSPDGSRIAFAGARERQWEVWIAPADGSQAAQQVTSGIRAHRVRWYGERGSLLVMGQWGGEEMALREVDPQTGESEPLDPPLGLGSEATGGSFDVSADGTLLVLSREEASGDLWLLEADSGSF